MFCKTRFGRWQWAPSYAAGSIVLLLVLACRCLASEVDDIALIKCAGWSTTTGDLLKALHERTPTQAVRGDIDRLLQLKVDQSETPETTAAAARILAARGAVDAIDPLLRFAPFAGSDWIQEEILKAVATLAVRRQGLAPPLVQALNGPAAQRGYAAYVLGAYGGFEQRAVARKFLDDVDPTVRSLAAAGLLGKVALPKVQSQVAADEALLTAHRVSLATPSLFKFLQARTLEPDDRELIEEQIRALGSDSYVVRSRAFAALLERGSAALDILHAARRHPDLEVARRVHLCLEAIKRGPGPALPAAVVRLLVAESQRAPAGEIIRVLLDYVPFAEDEFVEDEVITALCIAATRGAGVEPRLTLALTDPHAARRGAAAAVLGRVGVEDQRAALATLLNDDDSSVRFRAARALCDGQDERSLPALIALLDATPDLAARAEEVLQRLAGASAPLTGVDAGRPGRQDAVRQWQLWWHKEGPEVAWQRLGRGNAPLGLLTIAEYESARGRPGGRVWERGPEGDARWMFTAYGAMDAQTLPNGRVLVAENIANRVTERDRGGEIKWELAVENNPVACQRLPNGNTFVATYNELLEVTPDQKVVYSHRRGTAYFIFSAQKLATGRIVCMTAQGTILEIDARTGKDLRTLQVGQPGGWCGVEALPNGRYLVATMTDGMVREIDADNKTNWSCQYPGVFRATRLPNGHTVVASMSTRKVAEFDRAGQLRWESTCEGRPWSLRQR